MLNILVAIGVWAREWSNHTVKVHCDNLAVVSVLSSGKAKNAPLAVISRNIFMTASQYDILLKVSHIPGKNNQVANVLSRWEHSENIIKLIPSHSWIKVHPSKFHLDYEI